jgi:ribosome recycling factor
LEKLKAFSMRDNLVKQVGTVQENVKAQIKNVKIDILDYLI